MFMEMLFSFSMVKSLELSFGVIGTAVIQVWNTAVWCSQYTIHKTCCIKPRNNDGYIIKCFTIIFVVTCPEFSVTHGTIHANRSQMTDGSFVYPTTVYSLCSSGYTLIDGPPVLYCQVDGTWTHSVKCQGKDSQNSNNNTQVSRLTT